jgi:hypothetical protein
MSRREVPAKESGRQVFVGWDHALLTFFLQVYDPSRDEEENPVVWRGASRRELYDLDDLLRVASPHAEIDAEMRATLYGDRDEGR